MVCPASHCTLSHNKDAETSTSRDGAPKANGHMLFFTEADGFRSHCINYEFETHRSSVGNAFEPVVLNALQKEERIDGRAAKFEKVNLGHHAKIPSLSNARSALGPRRAVFHKQNIGLPKIIGRSTNLLTCSN